MAVAWGGEAAEAPAVNFGYCLAAEADAEDGVCVGVGPDYIKKVAGFGGDAGAWRQDYCVEVFGELREGAVVFNYGPFEVREVGATPTEEADYVVNERVVVVYQ